MRIIKADLNIFLLKKALPNIICAWNLIHLKLLVLLITNSYKIINGVHGTRSSYEPEALFID